MAKVSLTKAELPVLDVLIAEMQSEGEAESAPQDVDMSAQAMF